MRQHYAFTLLELLVVLSILSMLAALLFPAFVSVRGQARQTSCLSNLRQIGQAISMYSQDYEGFYPYAVDPVDRANPAAWSTFPEFQANIWDIPLIQDVSQSYVKSKHIFQCPTDSGFIRNDFNGVVLNAVPSSFSKFGTSYYYRSEIAAKKVSESDIRVPSQINLLFDGAGYWHGTLIPISQRYNVLFADAHVKTLNRNEIDNAWDTPLIN